MRGIFRKGQKTRFQPSSRASFLVEVELSLCWDRHGPFLWKHTMTLMWLLNAIEIICVGQTLWMFRLFGPSKPLKRIGLRWGHDGHVRKDIFDFIISKLGSLRRMDKQIRALMAEMLMRNLSNVERATGNLVDSLGPVVTLNEECFQSHVASRILQIYSNYSKFCTHCDFLSTHKTVTRPMELTHLSN